MLGPTEYSFISSNHLTTLLIIGDVRTSYTSQRIGYYATAPAVTILNAVSLLTIYSTKRARSQHAAYIRLFP